MKMKQMSNIILVLVMLLQLSACSFDGGRDFNEDGTELVEQNVTEDIADAEPKANTKPLYIIFNFDTEDNRGSEPNLIEGDLTQFGIEENCGIDYIMDTFDAYGAKANFFVNVYEYANYDEDGEYMASLLKHISDRGFEIGLHTHYNENLEFYNKELTEYSFEEQKNILKFGTDFIENATGKRTVVHRGGSYCANEDTIEALKELGVEIDSSFWYGSLHNEFPKIDSSEKYSNQIFKLDENLTEMPVISVFDGNNWRKLDIDSLSYENLIDTFEIMQKSEDFNCVQIMAHSFSFMDINSEKETEPLIVDGSKKIYGEDTADKEKLEKLLNYISESENMEIITFEEYLNKNLDIPDLNENGSFIYLANEELAFRSNMIEFSQDGNLINMKNCFESSEAVQYAWNITDMSGNLISKTKYAEDATMNYDFSGKSGIFKVKSYVAHPDGRKVSIWCAKITVENGEIINLERL